MTSEASSPTIVDPQRGAPTLAAIGAYLSPRRISGVYLGLLMIAFFTITTDTFFTSNNARNILSEQAITAIVAMGLTIALAAGVFDLSIAGTIGLANIVVAKLLTAAGMSAVEAILLTLLLGAVIGLVNGILVTTVRIDPFIATLGTNSILIAMIILVSENRNVLGIPPGFQEIGLSQIATIPLPVFYMLAIALVSWYVLSLTPIGRRLYATGGGREVARLAGVPTRRYIICSFICSATIAAAAGILLVTTIGSGTVDVGTSYLLPAFAAGFLGATQIRPGRFNIWGTVLAVYILAIGVKGLVLLGAEVWIPNLFNGVALIVAVGVSGLQRRARTRRSEAAESTGRAEAQ